MAVTSSADRYCASSQNKLFFVEMWADSHVSSILLYNLFGKLRHVSYNPIVVLWLRFKALKLKQHEFRAWLQQLLIHVDKFYNLSSVLHV